MFNLYTCKCATVILLARMYMICTRLPPPFTFAYTVKYPFCMSILLALDHYFITEQDDWHLVCMNKLWIIVDSDNQITEV